MEKEITVEQIIGKRIGQLRRAKGYTQQQFAEIIGLSTNYLSDIERGKSSARLDKLVTIINALGCSAGTDTKLKAPVLRNSWKASPPRIEKKLLLY